MISPQALAIAAVIGLLYFGAHEVAVGAKKVAHGAKVVGAKIVHVLHKVEQKVSPFPQDDERRVDGR